MDISVRIHIFIVCHFEGKPDKIIPELIGIKNCPAFKTINK
jgi:hypothetical protein